MYVRGTWEVVSSCLWRVPGALGVIVGGFQEVPGGSGRTDEIPNAAGSHNNDHFNLVDDK